VSLKVTLLTPGAGCMFCGACSYDISLARGLIELGCDVQLIPLYLPLNPEDERLPGTTDPFFGGVNVFLQQYCGLFRHTPRAVDRLFDSGPLLRLAARRSGSTEPARLGPMTVSMLEGADGHQRKELERLLRFLEPGPTPDAIHLPNMLLSGIAPSLRERLLARIVCGLQGEDEFVDEMPEPHRSRAHDLMRQHARFIDRFVSPTDAYAAKMAEYLDIPRDRIQTVAPGISVDDYPLPESRRREPFTVGYLSRITSAKGLDLLIDAVCRLTEDGRDVRLKVAGQKSDEDYWESVLRKVDESGLADRVEFSDVPDLKSKVAFFHECSVFSVPSRTSEVRGTVAIEAMTAGLPVVLPDVGAYHDIIGLTEGGLLFPAGDVDMLANALALLQDDPDRADRIGLASHDAACYHYSDRHLAENMAQIYRELGRRWPR